MPAGRSKPSAGISRQRLSAVPKSPGATYGRPVTAFGTHEMTPGVTTGHLPALPTADERVRQAYADDWRSWWQNPQGRDILYSVQGVPVGQTRSTIGYYEGKTNPGQAATPSVFLTGPRGQRRVANQSEQVLNGTEATRAYFDGQDAGGWSVRIPGQKLSHSNAYGISLPEESPHALEMARSIAEGHGLPHIIHHGGRQAVVTQLDRDMRVPLTPELTRAIDAEMRARLGSGASPVHLDSGYLKHRWDAGVGSGVVTRKLLERMHPAQIRAFDSPEVRERVLRRFDQDAELSAKFRTPFRHDLQNARQIFVRKGIEGLDAALSQGVLPLVAMGLFLPYLLDAGSGQTDEDVVDLHKRRRLRRRRRSTKPN